MSPLPSGKEARDNFAALLAPLAETPGNVVQKIINGDPDGKLRGESPIVMLLNRGPKRNLASLAASTTFSKFKIETWVLVADLTPNGDDIVEEIETAVVQLMADNPTNAQWTLIATEDAYGQNVRTEIFGVTYRGIRFNVIISMN